MFPTFKRKPVARSAALSKDITSVDYANQRARIIPVRLLQEIIPKLSDKEREFAYRYSALISKGINKKSRDVIRKGFRVVPDEVDRDDAIELNKTKDAWMRETQFRTKTMRALREMFVFGDGFLELGFGDNGPSDAEPPKNRAPTGVFNIDPLSIRPVLGADTGEVIAYLNGKNVRGIPRGVVDRFAAGEASVLPRDVAVIHPRRIRHFQVNSLREHPDGLGISAIDAAYINVLGKMAGDLSAGDVLEWYSKGFFTLNIEYATPEELEEAKKQLAEAKAARKNFFVSSERGKFDIKSPAIGNVKQFYDNFAIEFSAALEMPTMVLLGVQKGTVTGSGTDLGEYYDDILSFQELTLSDPMLDIFQRVLGRDDFAVEWVPLFVDKQTEADIVFKRSQASAQVYGAGILTRRETIRFLRDGELPNPDLVPDGYSAQGQVAGDDSADEGVPEEDPAPAPKDDEEPEEALTTLPVIIPLTDEDRALIAASQHERKLGERILRDQEVL